MSAPSVSLDDIAVFLRGLDDNSIDESNAVGRLSHSLGTVDDHERRQRRDLLLRIVHYCVPPSAIDHSALDRRSVATKIREHLIDVHGHVDSDATTEVADDVASLLRNLQGGSSGAAEWKRSELLIDQQHQCAHCRAPLDRVPETMRRGDVFKPYSDEIGPHPETDHVEPASWFGTDDIENLQVLCQLCNRAKSDDRGLNSKMEFEYATTPLEEIPAGHRARVLYYTIEESDSKCAECGSTDRELTVRPVTGGLTYARINLRVLCVMCASFDSNAESPSGTL
ncbi:HNH endonuclease [Haloarchaeobius sp. TZWSO28]|uniref:HNH endonuclease n=1 Tax=Haloarchaeobius sp. TZWSO28 TaxID=3446119 RepID=UPI003EBC5308